MALFWIDGNLGSPAWNLLSNWSPLGYLIETIYRLAGEERWAALGRTVFDAESLRGLGPALAWSMECTSDFSGAFLIPYLAAGFFARQRRVLVLLVASSGIALFFTWVNSENTYWLFPLLGVALAMPFLILVFLVGSKLAGFRQQRWKVKASA